MSTDGARPTVVPVDLAWFGFLHAYLVLGERVVIVDAGYPSSPRRILRALSQHGITAGDVSLIVLTHGHLDHLGGARELQSELRAPVALHRLDAEIARTGHDRPLRPTDLRGRIFLPFMPRTAPAFEPDIVHDGTLDLAEFGVAGRTIPTPGHTPGSVSVLLEDATIAGDVAAGGFIRRHSAREPYFADDREELRRSVARLLAEASDGPVHVGHRGPLDRQGLAGRFGVSAADRRDAKA